MIIKTDQTALLSYLEDASNIQNGHAEKVYFPESIEEVSDILKESSAKGIPVTVSGGGTGTTGGRVPMGGIALSMERLNRIRDIVVQGDGGGYGIVQAGVLVEDLKNEAEKLGLFYVSHPTEKTAFVGGTVATNASGARSLKYGSTRNFVRSLTVVLSDGSIATIPRGRTFLVRGDNAVRFGDRALAIPMPTYRIPAVKNSAGYFVSDRTDLADLLVGQEGTLAVVVEIEMGLIRNPEDVFSCCAFFNKEADAWSFAREARTIARSGAGKGIEMIDPLSLEYLDRNALHLLKDTCRNIPRGSEASILFEQAITEPSEDAVVSAWQELMERHGVSPDDTWVAMSEKSAADLIELRYAVPVKINEIVKRSGFQKLSTDIAVPDDKLPEMMRCYEEIFAACPIDRVVFGHIGESHLHMNMLPKTEAEFAAAAQMCRAVVRRGITLGGTVSAEHGIGKTRHAYLEEMYGRKGILEMARLKKALDPACILGLDNIFPKILLNGTSS